MDITIDTVENGGFPVDTRTIVLVAVEVCWICQRPLSKRWSNKTTKLCFPCHCELLDKVIRQKKRARVKGLEATLTTAQWATLLHSSQGHCYYCHNYIGYRALTMEHLIPVAHGGGTTFENCVPACMDCNWNQWLRVKGTVQHERNI